MLSREAAIRPRIFAALPRLSKSASQNLKNNTVNPCHQESSFTTASASHCSKVYNPTVITKTYTLLHTLIESKHLHLPTGILPSRVPRRPRIRSSMSYKRRNSISKHHRAWLVQSRTVVLVFSSSKTATNLSLNFFSRHSRLETSYSPSDFAQIWFDSSST